MMNWVSIDGFYADESGSIDWIVRDPEVDKATHGVGQGKADTMLCGRVTYQEMESFWPRAALDPNLPAGVKAMADEVNQMQKVVFSRTLTGVTWENSRLVRDDLVGEVKRLKDKGGSEMMLFGSGTIVQQLTDAGLIDDYVLIVTPVILGKGKPLFEDVTKLSVKLVSAKSFASGNVLLHYMRV
jgi:dihydrofolate reductase